MFIAITFFHLITLQAEPGPFDYWWLAFVPFVLTVIIFFMIYFGYKRFLRGDRFVAKIFGVSEEDQKAKIREFQQRTKEEIEKKESQEV